MTTTYPITISTGGLGIAVRIGESVSVYAWAKYGEPDKAELWCSSTSASPAEATAMAHALLQAVAIADEIEVGLKRGRTFETIAKRLYSFYNPAAVTDVSR